MSERSVQSDRKETLDEAEPLFRQEESLLSAIVDSSDDAILSKTLDGIITSWNQGAERMYGYTASEVIGKHVSVLVPAEMPDEIPVIMRRLNRGERIERYETIRRRKDGSRMDISLTVSPVRDKSGVLIGASAIAREITEEKRLRQLRDFLASIVESTQDAVFSKSLEGIILSWNRGAEKLYGYTSADVIGRSVTLLSPPELESEIAGFLQKIQKGESVESHESIRVRQDGSRVQVSLTISPIRDRSGKIIAASTIARDITARKQAEAERDQLLHDLTSSLNEKNVLLQEVYHRVKNNLQLISSLLELRSRYIEDPLQTAAFTDSIARIRAMALIHEKLYQTHRLDRVDFAGYSRTLVQQLLRSYTVDKNIELVVSGNCALPLGKALSLGLVFNELVVNSLKHAFPGTTEGKIAIDIKKKRHVITINFSDNGIGLPDHIDLSNAESFGFRIVRLLMAQIQGTIQVSRNGGTRFEMTVPV